jgi:two-component system, OmpR family, sensor histidine kinase KdpD
MAQPPDPVEATLHGVTQEGQPVTDEAHQVAVLECTPIAGDAEAPPECRYRTRGRHKIFLGYAAGVGKTYTMLSEAHRRMERGEDVVVGYVEPHGRPATQVLLDGLEQVPVKLFEYRGTAISEMDTAAVLRRRPQVALVDELAHTNAPGADHAKRWQSVLDILAAGIGVMSTVNVQHFESVNDAVFEITGVRPQETLPDSILRDADEVVLVDLTVNALLNRLQRGVIYAPDKVPRALEHFFREGNLLALRELALRTTAERVDESLDEYVEDHKIKDPWHTEDRVLVCVPASPLAKTLVRRGHRLARRFQGGFWTVFVRVPGVRLKPEEEAQLQEAFALSRDLGGKVLEVDGESAAREIVRLAVEHRATHLIVGQSRRSRLKGLTRNSVVTELLRTAHGVDVLVIADPDHR